MIQQTSLDAYQNVKPKISKRQQQILDSFKRHKFQTDKDISHSTGLPINCVTPRRGELVEKGLIKQHRIVMDMNSDGKKVTAIQWVLNDSNLS